MKQDEACTIHLSSSSVVSTAQRQQDAGNVKTDSYTAPTTTLNTET